MDPASCPICQAPDLVRTRIEGWILSGESVANVLEWCRAEGLALGSYTLDDHLDGGHIDIGRGQIVSMLVKYNREAEEVIRNSLDRPTGVPRGALNKAMEVRMRCVELVAKANNIIEQGPRTVTNTLELTLTPEQQHRMIEEAAKALAPPPAKLEVDADPTPEQPPPEEPAS